MSRFLLACVLVTWNAFPAQAQHHPLIGTWRSSAFTQAGPQQVELVILPNGAYSQQWRGQFVLNTYRGFWGEVSAGVYRFDIQDWEPKQWCGPLGCTPILQPPGTIARIEFQGADRFNAVPLDGSAPMVYQRVN
jgi:hypothetical protein